MGEKWYPAKEPIQIGDKLLPAVIKHTKDGKETGEPILASSVRQPLKGAKVHGGHCRECGCEMELYTNESARGVCDECAQDDPRWS